MWSYVDPLAQSGRGGGEDGMVLALFSDRILPTAIVRYISDVFSDKQGGRRHEKTDD